MLAVGSGWGLALEAGLAEDDGAALGAGIVPSSGAQANDALVPEPSLVSAIWMLFWSRSATTPALSASGLAVAVVRTLAR